MKMDSRSSSPSTHLHSDLSTTDSEDDEALERRWQEHCQRHLPTGVLQDYSAAGKSLAALCPPLSPRVPQIHRGPQETSIHTTFRRDDTPSYKIVFSYTDSPRYYEDVLRRLAAVLRGQHAVLKCKVFTNPTHADRLAFVYIDDTTVGDLLHIVQKIRLAFGRVHVDLRTPERRGRTLMHF